MHTEIEKSVVPPTCESKGYTEVSCMSCSYVARTETVPPTGHSYTASVHEPTCVAKGYTTYACACGDTYADDFTDALGHQITSRVIAPTCTEEGYTEQSCSRCDATYIAARKNATGHNIKSTVTPPGCETEGFTTHACENCSYSYVSDTVPPTGHTPVASYVSYPTSSRDGSLRVHCHCGAKDELRPVKAAEVYGGAFVSGTKAHAYGIDVSAWNGELDWPRLAALGVDFAILRIGTSYSGLDQTFAYNYAEAKKAGIAVGCYYYTYATTVAEALAQADRMLDMMEGYVFEYPVYMDLEDPSQEGLGKEVLTAMCEAFIERLQSQGYYAGLYTNRTWLYELLQTETVTQKYDIWYARWRTSGSPEWPDSYGTRTGLWQYTDSGVIDGFSCQFDFNVSFFDYPTRIASLGLNGHPVTV